MSMTLKIVLDVLLFLGAFFAFAGTVGLLRMPDCFCRMQSSTNIATLGLFLALIAGLLYSIFVLKSAGTSAKILFIAVIYIIQNPAGAHAIAKAAWVRGNKTVEMEVNDFVQPDETEEISVEIEEKCDGEEKE